MLFVLAAIGTYIVYQALAKMSVEQPDKGSFRSYSKIAFGRWAGFSNGWVYLFSEMLIMGSQLMALGLFTQFWFPNVPLWILISIYSVLGLLIILTGMNGFEKVENLFGVVKTAAIIMFIIVAVLILSGIIDNPNQKDFTKKIIILFFWWSQRVMDWFTLCILCIWGIEIMGLLVVDMKDPKEAPKSGKVMIIVLTIIYLLSIGLVLALFSWEKINTDESPFITALEGIQLPFVSDILNGILIIAGFSTMVAALYAVITILISLAEDRDAPAFLLKMED
ncbi:amino acid permease [Bacillus sp. N9]